MGSCRSYPEEARQAFQGSAWWLFEEQGEWLGFSPEVSEALEAAYQHWAREPEGGAGLPAEKRPGQFLYDAALSRTWWEDGSEHLGGRKPQGIRRVSVLEGTARHLPTRPEMQEEVVAAQAEAERLRQQAASEAEAHGQHLARLEEELRELRQEAEEQREVAARLLRGLSSVYPGRLVALAAGCEGLFGGSLALPAGSLGRVRSVEGSSAAVDFFLDGPSVWLPCSCLELAEGGELLSRPGTRVLLRGSGQRLRGVVCDPVDAATVNVLGADGRKRPCRLRDLELDDGPGPADVQLQAGDLVRPVDCSDSTAAPAGPVGMVLARDGESLVVRFQAEGPAGEAGEEGCWPPRGSGGCRDLHIHETQLQRDGDADLVRPGAAVRLRGRDLGRRSPPQCPSGEAAAPLGAVGVVYATHADGTAVIDFLGCFGCRFSVDMLEVTGHPTTVDHAVLRLLSECFSWHEVAWQHCEEREEAALRRLIRAAPT